MPEETSGVPNGAPANDPTPAQQPPAPPAPPAPAQETDWKAEAEKLTREARKWEDRAKQNHTAAKELETLRQQSMTETERAVAAARAEAAQEVALRYGSRLVDAEVRAAAAGRTIDVSTLLEGLDRSRFLTEDGEPDVKAISAWVDKLSPPPVEPAKPGFPDVGQGARGTASSASPSTAMNSLLRNRR